MASEGGILSLKRDISLIVKNNFFVSKKKIMIKKKGAIIIDKERCKGCGLCVHACPMKTLENATDTVNQKGYQYAQQILPNYCVGCASCATVCPDACISVYRGDSNLAEIIKDCVRIIYLKVKREI